MPTRKDKTNVAPIHREQVFIPASGVVKFMQEFRKRTPRGGNLEIVSPEFDLLTLGRGLFTNLIKPNYPIGNIPIDKNSYYRQVSDIFYDKSNKLGAINDIKNSGVVRTKNSIFNSPMFAKGNIYKGYENKPNTFIIKSNNNKLDWTAVDNLGNPIINPNSAAYTPLYKGSINNAPSNYFDIYKYISDGKYQQIFINNNKVIPITGLNTISENTDKMKCGGRRKAQLGLDIREGGIAIPIAPNMYYMDGRSHDNGGIAIGPNNKNGLEVEGGEVVKVGKNDIKVFSSVPLLRGVSPAQLVLGGANPNKVFKAQEEFKDKNRINDDGTRYEIGGEKRSKSKHSRPVTGVLPYGYTIRNLYAVENPYRKGIKGNIAKMYDSRTLGAGVDVVNGHPELYKKAKSGKMTKKQADETAVIHLRKDDNAIRSNYADVYGKAAADTLSYGPRFLVAQARYQQGNVRKAWGPIHKAMAKGDAKALKKAVLQVTPKDHEYRRKWIEDFKVYKMGGMIYTINGNIKNGLSLRPKAKMGKEEKIDDKTKIGEDGLVYKRGAYGTWYTDGTVHASRRKITSNKNIKQHSSKSSTPTTLEKISFTSPLIQGERKKIGNLYYEQTEDGQWKPTANQSSVTTRNSGKPVDFGMTRVGVNHPNSKYTYHPLTGEKINADGTIETEEPSVKSVTKVSSKKSTSSTPRRGESKSAVTTKSKIEPAYINYKPNKVNLAVKADNPTSRTLTKIDTPSTGGGTQSKDGRWVGQYKTTNVGDWIGLGSNLAGSVTSYFMTKSAIDKMPEPLKPIMAQAAKLKTRHNINPQLTNNREVEQINLAEVGHNTSSSNTSIVRKQRIMNEARDARNKLYGQKENIETQLINQDRLNRQSVMRDNIRAYNEYLNRLTATKTAKNQLKVSNINNLISGLTGSVNSILGNIESRRATNNTLRAIAAANPNVDARLIGGFDYYIDPITKKKYNKNQQYVGTING